MSQIISGLHHVTAIASDPQRNLDFYIEVLGLRLVKKTVNFDGPGTYHFYFGDESGSPGTILTFFPWPMASRGTPGVGQTTATSFSVAKGSLDFWEKRLLGAGVPAERTGECFGDEVLEFADTDGTRLEIVGETNPPEVKRWKDSAIPAEHALRGFCGVTLTEQGYESTADVLELMGFKKTGAEGNRFRFATVGGGAGVAPGSHVDLLCAAEAAYGRMGAGTVHHIAFRATDDDDQKRWREVLIKKGLDVTPVLDRTYFHSIYFREPGGVLFEIATDPPGFLLDEPVESLGESLKLPPWLESKRERIEHILPLVRLPKPHGVER